MTTAQIVQIIFTQKNVSSETLVPTTLISVIFKELQHGAMMIIPQQQQQQQQQHQQQHNTYNNNNSNNNTTTQQQQQNRRGVPETGRISMRGDQ